MANFHLEIKTISRGRGQSLAGSISYITGHTLRDPHLEKTFYHRRDDVLWRQIFLPCEAPEAFKDIQYLCDQMEQADRRWDARTARVLIGSLPNELPVSEIIRISDTFIRKNFTCRGLCAVAAIHEGRNKAAPENNNPHVHIIVSTRKLGPEGFSPLKCRELDRREFILFWRKEWAEVQNQAYARNHLRIRVSHESLEIQGIRKREPTIHLSAADWRREQRGERTPAGDRKRAIAVRSMERERQHTAPERRCNLSRTR